MNGQQGGDDDPKTQRCWSIDQRRDGLGHVTGKTVYVDDVKFRDMLHLKMVRSPVPHAQIKGIDFSEAEKVPGFVRLDS